MFVRAMLLLPAAALGVQYTSVRGTMGWLDRTSVQETGSPMDDEKCLNQARRTAGLVKRAIFYSPIKGKCLSQSLVLWHLLKRHGIQSDLRIGVKKSHGQKPFASGNFEAHAWVEYQGEILNERPDVYERFSVLDAPIQPPA